ncbi:MAG: tRNA lysidine(34) synthetase TilS [Candidatus Omnitrophica bacterium]|nr:tRNA lysidine(34) synthetase TilS [Candidatus Omnitrophota bacterium]
MVNIFKEVENFINKKKLVEKDDKILLAVSGGPDSVFLFSFFIYFSKKKNLDIKVAYIHHHLREEADKEVEFVKKITNDFGIEFYREDIEIKEKINIEKRLREERYKKLFEIARKTGCNKIATGHTLDDHMETIFINLFRGSGLSGLCGIWALSRVFLESDIFVIRPLLCLEKKEIIEYLEKNKIRYMIDTSNLSDDFFRNKIRHEVIPFLLEYKPSLKKVLFRMTEVLQKEEEFLKEYTDQILKGIILKEDEQKIIISREKFNILHDAIKRRVAGYIYKKIKKTQYIKFSEIEKILKIIEKGESIISKEKIETGRKISELKDFKFSIIIPGEINILNFKIKADFVSFSNQIFKNQDKFTGYFDFSKINGDIIIRKRRPGDKFIPLGFEKEKRLSRFMIDKKIPREEREKVLIFENNGKIMWVCGYEISEQFKVDKDTDKILKIEVKKLNGKNF